MTATATATTDDVRFTLPLGQSDAARAANAALLAGKDALAEAHKVWADVHALLDDAYGRLRPITDEAPEGALIRRLAVKVGATARATLGLASTSACGLYALTAAGSVSAAGAVLHVEGTDGGSDYLTATRRLVTPEEGALSFAVDDFPLADVVAFFDTAEEAFAYRDR